MIGSHHAEYVEIEYEDLIFIVETCNSFNAALPGSMSSYAVQQ